MKMRSMVVSVLFILLFSVFSSAAFAHEGRTVGEYDLHFGWREEPAFAGLMNGPEIFISAAHGEHAEEGEEAEAEHSDEASEAEETVDMSTVAVNLQAEVSFGDQTITLNFRPAFGETGHYIAELMPMLPGDYSFHLTGTIGELEVDEVFSSADGQYSSVEPPTDVMFPALPQVDNARLEALEARIAELEAQLAALQAN